MVVVSCVQYLKPIQCEAVKGWQDVKNKKGFHVSKFESVSIDVFIATEKYLMQRTLETSETAETLHNK